MGVDEEDVLEVNPNDDRESEDVDGKDGNDPDMVISAARLPEAGVSPFYKHVSSCYDIANILYFKLFILAHICLPLVCRKKFVSSNGPTLQ